MKNILFFLLSPIFLTSCLDKRIESPELVDLVYLDIQKDIALINKVVKLRETEIQTVRGEMTSLPVRSKGLLIKVIRIKTMSDDIGRFDQLKKYLEIKLKKREKMAKIRYELAFSEKKPWPDQEEFRKYLLVKNHSQMPVEEINKSDNSRAPTHNKDVNNVLEENKM